MGADRKTSSADRQEDSGQPEQISPKDRKAVQTLLSALKPISDVRDRPIPLPFAVVFLSVMLNEGQPVGWFAKDLNMTRFAVSKTIRSIGHRASDNAPGLGLVTIKRHLGYRVKTAIVLTDKGRAVAAEVFHSLRGTRAHKKTNRSIRRAEALTPKAF
jgi:hypothetical protein